MAGQQESFLRAFDPMASALEVEGFDVVVSTNFDENSCGFVALVVVASRGDPPAILLPLAAVRRAMPRAFVCAWHPLATEDALFRQAAFGGGPSGASMVSYHLPSLVAAARIVAREQSGGGALTCPFCGMRGFTEDELWAHCPLFHVGWPNPQTPVTCPICAER